ncbi:mechanosensitive ion channel family protein [Sphingosinithalassobacter sp. CS137]|uniref:mechanosensitive ion channel family protein n=1 Tax=Sphingosinithalassobacter sp. CS137 TaxID=2762748 RepID=UPI00165E3B68|nr:mechanosensitive ion channel family protein [Sphingosinithalassobacter sp. CS137]
MSNNQAAAAATDGNSFDTSELQASAQEFALTSVSWLQLHWLEVLIAIGVAAAIVALLHLVRHWGVKLCEKTPGITGWGSIFGKAIAKTGNFFIIMVAARLVVGYAAAPPAIAATVDFLFTVAAVFQAAIWAREIILGFVELRTEGETYQAESLATALDLIRVLVTVALFAIALIVVLSNLGVNVTGLVAGLGVGGIAIGLAAQGIFADLFAALSIIFDKPFKRGDSVSYDTTTGNIEAIGLKSTRIRAFTGEELIISNRNLLDKEITNNTLRSHRRAKFAIGVVYQTAPEVAARIPAILQEVVESCDRIFVRCGFVGFGASSLDFELEFDSEGPDYVAFYDGRTVVGIAIHKRFRDEGIEIAYPTQTTFTAAPDGTMVLPYPQVQPVIGVEGTRVSRDEPKDGSPA